MSQIGSELSANFLSDMTLLCTCTSLLCSTDTLSLEIALRGQREIRILREFLTSSLPVLVMVKHCVVNS